MNRILVFLVTAFVAISTARAQFTVGSPTTDWVVVPYRPGITTDYPQDQQTGSVEADIVGGGLLPSFYTKFIPGATSTTGTLYFRARLGADENPAGFKGACFLGIDANGDGKLDLFVGVNNSGNPNGIYMWKAGNNLNISPSTTSIDSGNPLFTYTLSASNYQWAIVNSTIDPAANTPALLNTDGRAGGGQTDYFLSFSVPFADLVSAFQSVGISVDSNSVMAYVMGTATQANSFNQDLNGVDGGVSSTQSWADLGAISLPLTPSGTPVNRPPVNTVPSGRNATMNTATPISGISVNDLDGNLSTVALTVSQGTLQVGLSGGATITSGASGSASLTLSGTQAQINSALGTLVYTPSTGFVGQDSLSVVSTDSANANDTDSVAITVTGNRAPIANDDVAETAEDTAKAITVLGNDTDVDNDPLTVTVAIVPAAQGTVTINGDGTLTFTPALNFNGTATISYTISDGKGGTSSAKVTVTVTPVNDAPVAADDSATTPEDTAKTIAVLGNDTDVDNDPLTVTVATVPAAQGTVTINSDGTLAFTPALNFNGTATISYTISDGKGGTSSAKVTVTVTPVNDAPVAADDSATTPEDTAKTIAVLGNDTDVDNDPLTVTVATVPAAQGTVTINSDGTLAFTPALNFNGTATISYTISDGKSGTSSAKVTVTVTPVNDAPVAADDTDTTAEDTAKTIAVLGNDTDVDNDPLTVTVATVPAAQGTVTINDDGTLAFTPALNFNGTATISYTISDGKGGTSSAKVTVTVTPVNDEPSANDDVAETAEDTAKTIAVIGNDTDPDNDPLTVTVATVPAAQGTVTINSDGTLAFTPALNFNGTATINYTISDGHGGTSSAKVTVTVTPVNDEPSANDDLATTAEDTAKTVAVLGNDTDLDNDPLTVTVATVPAAQGTVTINGDGTLTYTPALNFNGTATISYIISDGHGGTSSAKVIVTVTPVNDAPVAADDSATTAEDTAKTITVLGNDTDVDNDPLTVTVATVPTAQGTVAINSDGTLAFTPALNFNGTATINYTISDGHGGTSSAKVTVTVTPVNDAPVAADDTASTSEDTAKTIAVLGNDMDVDNDPLTVTVATVPAAQGTVTINTDGTLAFTPALNFNGTATISYTISDGHGGTSSAKVTVTVTPVNDRPTANDDVAETAEDTAKTIAVLGNDTDPDNDPLTVTVATVPAAQGTVAINGDGTLTFTPALNFNGTATISYTISDGHGETSSAKVTVTVLPESDAPTANDDVATTAEDTAKTIAVLGNDVDPDNDPLTVTVATVPAAQGTVAINGDGTLTYTPALNFNGTATISYTISDGNGGTSSAKVAVTVTPVNDAPVAADDTDTTAEDTAKTIAVLGNDTDPDNDPLTVTVATVPAAQGTVTINSDGTLTFTPALNFNGTATINYTISDGHGGTSSAKVTVIVTPVNDRPTANDDVAETAEDTAKTIPILGNDTDPDNDPLTVTVATVPPAQGTVTINGDGTLTYTPALNFNGTATISYTISDGHGETSSAVAVVTVTPVNDAPVAADDATTTAEDTAKTIAVLGNDTDADNDSLTVTVATVPTEQGTVTINADGTLAFTPALNFNGTATISYTISDGKGGASSAHVTVTVSPVNDEPSANDDLATTTEDMPKTIAVLGNDADPDNDPLTVTAATVPAAQGTVTINADGTLTYTPALNFNGTATISYSISDGHGGTSSAIAFVTVTPVNDPPLANDDTATTPQGRTVIIDVLENDFDVETSNLSVIKAVVYEGQGTVSINVDGTLEFTPAPNFTGTALLVYTVSDDNGGTASATVTVKVNGAPIATDDQAVTPMNTAKVIDVLANDADPEGEALTVTNATVVSTQGTVVIGGDGKLLFTPAQGVVGTVTLGYTIRDVAGNIASANVFVTVTAVTSAEPPVAVTDFATTKQQTPVVLDVLANDRNPGGGALTVADVQVDPAVGSATVNANSTITFTAAPGFEGLAVVTYTARNTAGLTATAPALITVTGGNVAPIASPDVATAVPGTPKIIHVLNNDVDPDGDPLTVTAAAVPSNEGVVTRNPDGTITFEAASNFTGVSTITYQVSDDHGNSASSTVTVTVSQELVNSAPVASNDTAATPVQTPVDVAVLVNDIDPDGDLLVVSALEVAAEQGTATLNPDGTVHFVPAAGFNDTARIRYTVDDGKGGTATAVLTVTVNDNPVAVTDVTSTPAKTPVTVNILANDTDPNGNPLTITRASVAPVEGTLVNNPDGTITFTPAEGFTGTALISYTISDGKGGTAEGTALITVNSPPQVAPDTAVTTVDKPVVVPVLENDNDPDGDSLTIIGATVDPAQGTVTINSDGTITFQPASTFTGPAVITYTVTDGKGGIQSGTATVIRANSEPTSEERTVYTYCGTALKVNPLRTAGDRDGDALTVISISRPSKGTATLQPDGYILYKPRAMFRGQVEDTFTVTLSDGKGGVTNVVMTVRAFAAIAGTYQGLLADSPAPAHVGLAAATSNVAEGYRGRITVALTDRATFSAKLELDGKTHRFSGGLTGALQFERVLRIGGRKATLQMKYDDMANRWIVTLQGAELDVRNAGDISRMTKSNRNKAARYTADIRQKDGVSSDQGAAVIRVRKSGVVSTVGVLPDGTAFSSSSHMDSAGNVPIYRWLGGSRATFAPSVGGIWHLGPRENTSSVTGEIRWRRSLASAGSSVVEVLEAAPTADSTR
ncbi:Ig-like domain-containing protein [Verrucomicrobiota bacterium sgz303538]